MEKRTDEEMNGKADGHKFKGLFPPRSEVQKRKSDGYILFPILVFNIHNKTKGK